MALVIGLWFVTDMAPDFTKAAAAVFAETQDKAEAFGKSLAERCGIEPVFKDERYTTVLASRYLHESNIKAKKQKKVIDQVAAEIILQDYLNTL